MNSLEISLLARSEARAKVIEAISLSLPLESVAASLADSQGFATNSRQRVMCIAYFLFEAWCIMEELEGSKNESP